MRDIALAPLFSVKADNVTRDTHENTQSTLPYPTLSYFTLSYSTQCVLSEAPSITITNAAPAARPPAVAARPAPQGPAAFGRPRSSRD
jgi:hypothetical protein